MADIVKLVIAIALVVLGIVGFYYYEDQAFLYRVLGVLVAVIVAGGIALTSAPGAALMSFGRSSVVEVRKSVWPTRKETTQTTLMVALMVIVIGLVLWLFDMFLLWAVKLITGQGG